MGAMTTHLPPRDAWHLARRCAGSPPVALDAYTSDLGRELATAITSVDGQEPRDALEAYLDTHYPDRKAAIVAELLDQTPDGPEPSAEADGAPARFKVLTAADALQPRPPRATVAEGLMNRRDMVLWFGDGGSKKTYAAVDLGVSVAGGESEWLDFAITQGTVLVIDEESGEDRLMRRLGDVLRGHGADADTPIFCVSLAGLNLRNATDVADLELLIAAYRPLLVIIDALMDVIPGADENSVADILPVLLTLRRVAEAFDCAILVIHHAGKNGGYRGSSAIKGKVDQMLLIESQFDSPNIDLHTQKARDSRPITFAAAAHFGIGDFHLSATGTASAPARYSTGERFVLRYLRDHGASSVQQIVDAADSCAPTTARQGVYRLAERGLVRRVDDGGRGSEALYRLTDDADGPKGGVPWD
jgi:hypothetical protein